MFFPPTFLSVSPFLSTIPERIYQCCAFGRKKPIFQPPRYFLYYEHNNQNWGTSWQISISLEWMERRQKGIEDSQEARQIRLFLDSVGQIFNRFPNSTPHIHRLHTHSRHSAIHTLQLLFRKSVERMRRSGGCASSWTSISMIRTVLDWYHAFIIILFCNGNDIHWLTQNNVEIIIPLNHTEWVTVALMLRNPQDGCWIGYIQMCLWAKRHISALLSTLFNFFYLADVRLAHSAQTLRSHVKGLY